MTFSYTFDQSTLFLVLYQHVSKKPSVIHKYSKIPQSTIYDYINKIDKNINILEHQQGQGRKQSIPDITKKKVVRATRRRPNSCTTRNLGNQYNIGKSTADRILLDKNFIYRKVRIQKALDSREKNNRVKFCKDMIKSKDKKILATFYSDETGYNLSEAHRDQVWNPPKKQVKIDFPKKDVRINCWGAISSRGATSIHIYKGTMNHEFYQDVLEEHKPEMDRLYPNGYYFQHDNLNAHSTAETWMQGQGFNIVNFPTYSPDLTPIENLWAAVKNAVSKDNPKTEKALCDSFRRNWEALTKVEKLGPYFENLHDRYVECINNKGNALTY